MNPSPTKLLSGRAKTILIPVAAVLALVVILVAVLAFPGGGNAAGPQVISQSFLQEIVTTSDLSTFEAIYNGIAEVTAEETPEEVRYYVSYNSTIKAGFDFTQVDIQIDDDAKLVLVTLPPVRITDISVDITSMDFIFMDDDANTETVSQEAYQACIDDATKESEEQTAIRDLAGQNAENVILALIEPFVDQLEGSYTIEIRTEGE